MAKNPNEEWVNEHTVYLADTGGGKGSMLRGNPSIPRPKDKGRIICWDTAAAYPGYFYNTRRGFIKGLESALNSGQGFSVGYMGGDAMDMVKEHEWWANVVWDVLDGDYRTHIIDEELIRTHSSMGKATGYAGLIMNESRKYGGVWHGTAQKPQEIPKTLISRSEVKYFGKCDECDLNYLSKWLSNTDELLSLLPGEFYRKEAGNVEKGRYAKVTIKRKMLRNGVIKVT